MDWYNRFRFSGNSETKRILNDLERVGPSSVSPPAKRVRPWFSSITDDLAKEQERRLTPRPPPTTSLRITEKAQVVPRIMMPASCNSLLQRSDLNRSSPVIPSTIKRPRPDQEISKLSNLHPSSNGQSPGSASRFVFSKPVSVLSMTRKDLANNSNPVLKPSALAPVVSSSSSFTTSYLQPSGTANGKEPISGAQTSRGSSILEANVDKGQKTDLVQQSIGQRQNLISDIPASTSKWSCGTCFVSNDGSTNECMCCKTARPFGIAKPADNDTSKPKWTCGTCFVSNDNSANDCACCKTSRPSGVAKPADNDTSKPKWTCGTCFVSNDNSANDCACCKTSRPIVGPNPVDNATIKETQKPKWSCGACFVSNDISSNECICCKTAKPITAAKPTDAPIGIKEKKINWSCTTCFLSNTSDRIRCIACESPKPGATFKPVQFGFSFSRTPTTVTTSRELPFGSQTPISKPMFSSTPIQTSIAAISSISPVTSFPTVTTTVTAATSFRVVAPAVTTSEIMKPTDASTFPFNFGSSSQKNDATTIVPSILKSDATATIAPAPTFLLSSIPTVSASSRTGFPTTAVTTSETTKSTNALLFPVVFGSISQKSDVSTTTSPLSLVGTETAVTASESTKPLFPFAFGSSSQKSDAATSAIAPAISLAGTRTDTNGKDKSFPTVTAAATLEITKPLFVFGSASQKSDNTTIAPAFSFTPGGAASNGMDKFILTSSTTSFPTVAPAVRTSEITKSTSAPVFPFVFGSSSQKSDATTTTQSSVFSFAGAKSAATTTSFPIAPPTVTTSEITKPIFPFAFGSTNQKNDTTTTSSSLFSFGGTGTATNWAEKFVSSATTTSFPTVTPAVSSADTIKATNAPGFPFVFGSTSQKSDTTIPPSFSFGGTGTATNGADKLSNIFNVGKQSSNPFSLPPSASSPSITGRRQLVAKRKVTKRT